VQHLSYALFLAMRQRLVVVSACSRFGAVYQGIATARSACLWCSYGSMSLQPAVDESSTLIHPSAGNKNSANFAFWAFSEVGLLIYGVLRSSA
jgi:hypothetical protein